MNVADIKTRVKRQFGDESAVQIADADIWRWISDAQQAIVIQNEALLQTTQDTLSVVAQASYSLPTDIVHLNSLLYKSFTLKKMSLQEYQEYLDGWQNPTTYPSGTPLFYMVYANSFTLYPTPQASGDTIRIFYSKLPTTVTSDSDALTLPIQYHEAIVMYCLQQAHQLDEDWAAAQQKGGELQQQINYLRDREIFEEDKYYPSITVLPQDL